MESTEIDKASLINKNSLYRDKNFLLLYFSTIFSTFGNQIYTFILPLFIYDLSKSAFAMSTMRVVDFLPNVLFGMIAGVVVDRMNRNIMLKYAGLIKVVLSTILIIVILLDITQLWHLYLLGFLMSTVGYTFGNAQHSIIPQLFEKSKMIEIQEKFSFINTFISIIGPSIAGMLLLVFKYDYLFIIYSISLLFIWISCLFLDQTITPERPVRQSFFADMKEGWKELFLNKILLSPTLAILFSNLATSLIIGVQVFYVLDILGETKQEIGWMFSMAAVGGLIGAKCIKPIRNKWPRGKIFISMNIIEGFALILFFFATSWWQIGILLAIRTFSGIIINIIYLAIRQEMTPNHLLGRVAGTSSMLMKLALPIGLFFSGLWAEFLPIPYLFLISASIVGVICIFLFKSNFKTVQ